MINNGTLITKDYIEVWSSCLQYIKNNINPQSFKTWFEPVKASRITDNILTIQVPNKFFYEWLEEHYVNILKRAIKRELGQDGRLEYQIIVEDHRKIRPSGQFRTNDAPTQIPQNPTTQIKNPFIIPGIKRTKITPQLKPSYTFDNFIEGDCNRLVRSAGIAVAKKPGSTAFNPLFIFGDVGLGKTHLAQAIGNEILSNFDNKNIIYVSTEKFTNQIIQAIKNNAVNDLVNFYQTIDVFIVDDIQFLANRTKTQEIFFHIFNQLHQLGKQIVVTSDRPPKDLNGMEERLISRFKWGLSADLSAPDLETRMAILEAKMNQDGIELPPNVIEFICYNIKNNIRELEGVLISLIAQSTLNGKEVDLALAKEVIKHFISNMSEEITVENIKNLVAEHFNIPIEKLQSKTRIRTAVIARQLSMYLAKTLTKKSLKTIGLNFGGRDHTTVLYACKSVKNLMDTDNIFKDTVHDLEKKIRMSLSGV